MSLCAFLVGMTPTASAAVDIDPQRVTVTGPGARAVVTRAPFRLAFADADGTAALSQVPNPGGATLPVAPTPDPYQPLGFDGARRPTLYAPLAFTVGARVNAQDRATLWNGNQLLGTEGGIMYSARDVVDVKAAGAGAELRVSTSDPSGRQLVVTITPAREGAMRVQVRPTPDTGVATVADSFVTGAGEAFHGFGGRHNAIDQRGNDFYNWAEQENFSAGPFQPAIDPVPGSDGERYLFPNGATAAYYPQGLFVSSRPYGFMLDRGELSLWRMASDREDAWQVESGGPALDYVVAPGGPAKAVETVSALNGRHRPPPEWVLGVQDSENIEAGDFVDQADAEQRVRDDLAEIDKHDLDYSAFDIFGWFLFPKQTQQELIDELRRRDIKPLLYFVSFFGASSAEGQELQQKGYVARTATGQPYVYPTPLGPMVLLDFTNPDAVKWWQARARAALDMGGEGFMEDFGESVQVDMRFANGETGETMHNRYCNFYHRATRELIEDYEREHPDRHIWVYTRCGYSGTQGEPGAAAYEGGNFPGDNNTDWSRSNGLASAAPDMLNRGIGGAYGYTTDIGGYSDSYTPTTTKELFLRWSQWAALSPVMRIHNSLGGGTQHPWSYDAETLTAFKRISGLRARARPLIRDLWRDAAQTGMPIARPLWLEFPGDLEAAKQEQAWMLGPDVLVAPVVKEGATARDVYFPRGCWESPETGEQHQGPSSARVDAPLGRLPYFFRCGTNPFAQGADKRGCLSRRSPIGPRNVGRVRVGMTRRQLLRQVVPQPVKRTRHAFHWCVKDRRGGRVSAVFGARRRSVLVVTSARAHGNRKLRPRSRIAALRRAYPRRRRVIRGVFRASGRNPRVFVVRRGRVRLIGVADRQLLRTARKLRIAVRRVSRP